MGMNEVFSPLADPAPGLHVVMFSGGLDSWAAAKRVVAAVGPERTLLLFADTKIEDEDLYRFLDDAATNVGAELIKLAEGRDPWQVFMDKRFIGNTRVDPCSRILKREFLRTWLEKHHEPATTTIHVGIHWDEAHRLENVKAGWGSTKFGKVSWPHVRAPMCEPPFVPKLAPREAALAAGIALPRLYGMGFPHNNCGGFCVKAGQAHFALLLEKLPERYAFHEAKEQEWRKAIGKDCAILRDRRGGKTLPMTLETFRERVQGGDLGDKYDWGGCGCFGEPQLEMFDAPAADPGPERRGDPQGA